MGKRLLVIIAIFSTFSAYCQTPQLNLEKYWHYRDRLRERFVIVSHDVEEEGVNIPAGEIFNDTIGWSDGNSIMSHYLALLSTELYLLKTDHQDYSKTLAELYYAMLALERLDLYSESHWRRFNGKLSLGTKDSLLQIRNICIIDSLGYNPVLSEYTPLASDINGMHLRDDITPAFWNKHQQYFGVSVYDASGCHPLEEISQDVMFHNIEGLALVARLIGIENVAKVPVTFKTQIIPQYLTEKGILKGDSVDFSLWAKDIIRRYIVWFQTDKGLRKLTVTNHWVLRNSVTGELVQQGSGDEGWDSWLFYNYGLIEVGKTIVGENLRTKKGFKSGEKIFKKILCKGFNATVDDVSVDILAPGHNRLFLRIGLDILTVGIYELHILTGKHIAKFANRKLGRNIDDYKVRSLACTGNVLGDSTYIMLVNRRSHDPYNCGQQTIYEHFPLINIALYDLDGKNLKQDSALYRTEKNIYKSLLNEAPFYGPTGNCSPDPNHFAHNWSETSRCVWPENLRPSNRRPCKNFEFNGMDYMMLYNLYSIAFGREGYEMTQTQTENAEMQE